MYRYTNTTLHKHQPLTGKTTEQHYTNTNRSKVNLQNNTTQTPVSHMYSYTNTTLHKISATHRYNYGTTLHKHQPVKGKSTEQHYTKISQSHIQLHKNQPLTGKTTEQHYTKISQSHIQVHKNQPLTGKTTEQHYTNISRSHVQLHKSATYRYNYRTTLHKHLLHTCTTK